MTKSNIALRIDHAEDEQSPNRRQHNDSLEPEEVSELIRPEKRQRQMNQPEQEERQQSSTGNAHGLGYRVRDVSVVVAEDCTEHVRQKCGAGVQLHTVPDDCQCCTSKDEVVGSPHAKDASRDNRIPNVVHTCTSRVEEHRDGRDGLTDEDCQDGLPPVQADSYHYGAESPVAKG